LCHAGWGLALDQDTCIHILGECGFLPTGPIGLANLSEIPDGLDAKETEKFLRENSMEIIERLRRYSEASLEPFVDPTLARSDHNRRGPLGNNAHWELWRSMSQKDGHFHASPTRPC